MSKKDSEQKVYILELKNGSVRKITVPAHWKLTYGNVVPFEGKGSRTGEARIALRLYDGNKENLRAVYTDVVSFRAAEIGTLEKRVTTQRKGHKEHTPQGERDVVVEARVEEWVDPDDESPVVPSRFKSLPKWDDMEEEDGQ